jgi:hypothetical protein
MEPESHRLDREAMYADRLAAAERVRREIDETVSAAAEKRRAYLERFVNDLRIEAWAQAERRRLLAGMEKAYASRLAAGRKPASPGTGRTDRWEEVDVQPLPLAWAAVGEG